MRLIAAALLVLVSFAVGAAPQDVKIVFGDPTTGGAPSGYRLYKDSALVGPVVSGQVFAGLLNDDGTAHILGIESVNAACGGAGLAVCPRVNNSVTIPPILQPPGPVININVSSPCTTATPPCTIVVTQSP